MYVIKLGIDRASGYTFSWPYARAVIEFLFVFGDVESIYRRLTYCPLDESAQGTRLVECLQCKNPRYICFSVSIGMRIVMSKVNVFIFTHFLRMTRDSSINVVWWISLKYECWIEDNTGSIFITDEQTDQYSDTYPLLLDCFEDTPRKNYS